MSNYFCLPFSKRSNLGFFFNTILKFQLEYQLGTSQFDITYSLKIKNVHVIIL